MRSTKASVSERVLSLVRKYGTKNLRQWEGFGSSLQEFGLKPEQVTDGAISAASLELRHADERMQAGIEEFNGLFSTRSETMSETNEAVATVETTKAPKAKKAMKPVAKASAKKPAKGAKAPAAKKEEGERAPKLLYGTQEAILRFLSKRKAPVDLKGIAEGAEVPYANLTIMIGSLKEDRRVANDAKHFPSLLTLKYIKRTTEEKDNGGDKVGYVITEAGVKILKKVGEE